MRMIKDIACGVLIMVIILGMMGWAGYMETTYDLQGTVVECNANIATVEDTRGHLWEYETEKVSKGDNVKITFFDNHTHRIYDDEIVKIKVLKKHN